MDQEGILLRYVHLETYESITSIASIENLENARADGVVEAIKKGFLKSNIDIDNLSNENSKLVCVNIFAWGRPGLLAAGSCYWVG
jgi:hypothetical protein